MFLVSIGCSPESIAPVSPTETCPTIVTRYKIVVVTDAITDVILVVIPGYLCWQLQMSIVLKVQVLAVFAFRLPLVALSGLFLKTWIRSLSIVNPGIHRTPAIIFQQAELCVSLMAATILYALARLTENLNVHLKLAEQRGSSSVLSSLALILALAMPRVRGKTRRGVGWYATESRRK